MTPDELDAAIREIEARDENLEGIPVFLVLEDVAEPARRWPDDAEGRRLGEIAETCLRLRVGSEDKATLDDVALALKVVGLRHFRPTGPAEPA